MKKTTTAQESTTERRGYRLREVEQMFGISRMSVRRAINASTLSTFKIGGVVLVRVEDIDRLVKSGREER